MPAKIHRLTTAPLLFYGLFSALVPAEARTHRSFSLNGGSAGWDGLAGLYGLTGLTGLASLTRSSSLSSLGSVDSQGRLINLGNTRTSNNRVRNVTNDIETISFGPGTTTIGSCPLPSNRDLQPFQSTPHPTSLAQSRPLPAAPFVTGIRASGPIDVNLQFSDTVPAGVTVEGRPDVLSYLDVAVLGAKLQIRLLDPDHRETDFSIVNGVTLMCHRGVLYHVGYLRVTVTLPRGSMVSSIELTGTGNFMALSPMQTPSYLTITTQGSGNVTASVYTGALTVNLQGAGRVTLAGQATSVNFLMAGAGTIDGRDLLASSGEASVAGAGDIMINCWGSLEAQVAGVGRIRYKGRPRLSQSVSGFGSIDAY